MQHYNVRIKAFDSRAADQAAALVVGAARSASIDFSGPLPLPTKREITTVLRSTHVNKTAREQFELLTHKRLIRLNLTPDQLDFVARIEQLVLPAGASIALLIARRNRRYKG